jgi:hypothetical protein
MKETIKKTSVAFAALALSAGLFAGITASAQAAGSCRLVANAWMSGSTAEFQGGRLNCSNNSYTHVLAKRDVSLSPDQVFWDQAIPTGQGLRSGSVAGTRGHRYYTETYSATGAKMQSARVGF